VEGRPLDFDDLQSEKKCSSLKALQSTKSGHQDLTFELARRLQGTGVTAVAVNPGLVQEPQGAREGAGLGRQGEGVASHHRAESSQHEAIWPAGDAHPSKTLTVREWLSTQSFEEQRAYGLRALKIVLAGGNP